MDGRNIGRLSIIFGDTNAAESIVARLIRKRITAGGVVNAAPQTVATISSVGTVTGMRGRSTTTVSAPLIDEARYFYYVEVNMQNFNTPLVGVQIEHKPTCP